MKRRTPKNKSRNTKRRSVDQRRGNFLLFESLEPRRMLAPVVQGLDWVASTDATGHQVTLTFAEAIDPATFDADDVATKAPDQSSVYVVSVNAIVGSGDRQFEILVDSSASPAVYALTVGPDIADPFGNLMDQDGDGTGGESIEDQFVGNFSIIDDVTGWAFALGTGGGGRAPVVEGGDIIVDNNDHLYISGSFSGTIDFDLGPAVHAMTAVGGTDGFIAKYTRDQQLLWVERFGGQDDDEGARIALDSNGDLSLTGRFFSTSADFGSTVLSASGTESIYVAKIDSLGQFQWATSIVGAEQLRPHEIAVAKDPANAGHIYIAGEWKGDVDFDPGMGTEIRSSYRYSDGIQYWRDGFLLKLDSNGNYEWIWTVTSVGINTVRTVGVDSAGYVYIGGRYSGGGITDGVGGQFFLSPTGPDFNDFVGKIDPVDGSSIWYRALVDDEGGQSLRIVVSDDGDIYAAGDLNEYVDLGPGAPTIIGDNQQMYVMKLDTNNNFKWVRQFTSSETVQPFGDIGLDDDGDLLLTGKFIGTVDLDPSAGSALFTSLDVKDAFVVKLDPFGNFLWGHQLSGEGGVDDNGRITSDSAGSIYLKYRSQTQFISPTGDVFAATPGMDAFVVRLDVEDKFVHEIKFTDSFENGSLTDLWGQDSQNDWFRSTQRAVRGNYSAEVDGRATNAELTVASSYDLSSYNRAELTFSWYIESTFDNGEFLALEFSSDNGASWNEIRRLSGNIDLENSWHHEQVPLDSQYLDSQNFKFRFLGTANRSNEDGNVDNVELLATSLAGPPNQSPSITTTPIVAATEDLLYTYDVDASDPDTGDTLTFSLDAAPSDMTVDPNTGVIEWTPTNDQVGENLVTVRVADQAGAFETQSFNVTVTNVNDAPTIDSSPVTTATAESLYSYDVEANDPDAGDTLTFSLDDAPPGMTIEPNSGLIQWTPASAQTASVSVRVQDTGGLFSTQSYAIDVAAVNHDPVITSTALTDATEDSPYSYDVEALDSDIGDTLTFSLDVAPSEMTIDGVSGLILWTPTNDDVGANAVTVRVVDQAGALDTQLFNVTVANTNDAPLISSTPVTGATEDQSYSYDVEATDPDVGDMLTYILDTVPAGMTISSSGLIQWIPSSAQVGDHVVNLRVDDVAGASDTQNFVVTVDAATFNDTVVFSDNFENGPITDHWSQDSQNDWRRVTSKRFDGSYSAEVDGRATNATLISDSINMSGYGSAELTFSWLIEKGFDSGEFLALDFKDEFGVWVPAVRILEGNVDQENTWHEETVALDPQYLHDNFQFRYRATVSSSREDAYVDSVELLATSAASRGAVIDPNSRAEALALADLSYLVAWADDGWNSDTDLQNSDYKLRIANLPGNLLGSTVGIQDHVQSHNDLIDRWFADVSTPADERADEHNFSEALFDEQAIENWHQSRFPGSSLTNS